MAGVDFKPYRSRLVVTRKENSRKGTAMKIINHIIRRRTRKSCTLVKGVRYEGESDEVHVYYMHLGENDGVCETATREFGTEAAMIDWTVVCSYNPNKFEVRVLNNSSSIMMFPL